jgi:hypothetical protein
MKRQNTRFNEDSEELGGTPSSGYFLAKGREVPDANLITTSGTYQTDGDSLNLPSGAYSYGSLLVQSSGGDGVQIYTANQVNAIVYIRVIEDGIWHSWKVLGMAEFPRQDGDANLMTSSGTYGVTSATANLPVAQYGTLLAQHNSDIGTQIYTDYHANVTYIRTWSNSATAFTAWKEIGGGGARVVARCSFNGEASPISIYGSYGVSGVTDNGSGDYTVNFSGSYSGYTANWSVGDEFDEYFGNISNAYNSNSLRVRCLQVLDNPEKRDCAFGFLSIMV